MNGISWRTLLASTVLVVALGWLTAYAARPAVPSSQDARRAPARLAAAEPPLSPATVVTKTVHLPFLARDFERHYVYPYGVATYDGASPAQGLVEMEAAGSRWVTTVLYWAAIEPNAPVSGVHTYNWTQYDTMVSAASNADTDLFVLVTGNPAWAAALSGGPVTNTANLVNFVSVAAERYDGDGLRDAPGSPVISTWSFYAEPDNYQPERSATQGKGVWGDNPGGYAAMLVAVANAIHAANPSARVTNGGLAYDYFTTEGGPYVRGFLSGVLQALNTYPGGAPAYLDGVAFHYYPINRQRWPTIKEKALEIRGIMNANGASALPLVVPEMGFWSGSAAGSSELLQAQTLVQMYVRGFSVRIRQMSWFSVFDHGETTESHGLFINQSLAHPKPAYYAYKVLTTELPWVSFQGAYTASGIEGYHFRMLDGSLKTVLWSTSGSRNAAFTQECARQAELLGGATLVRDGGAGDNDGADNGKVTLSLTANQPVYVGVCP